MAKCAICESTFGISLWKHTCVLCRRQVCGRCSQSSVSVSAAAVARAETTAARDVDDGNSDEDAKAPKASLQRSGGGQKSDSHNKVKPSSDVIEARVCIVCQESGKSAGGRRLGGGDASASPTSPATHAAAPLDVDSRSSHDNAKPDPNSEAEREKRARLVEARMSSKKGTGTQAAAARPKPAPPQHPPVSAPAPAVAAPPAATAPAKATAGPSAGPANPALEAALRRQAQGRKDAGPEKTYSAEKTRLLREIEAIHARTGADVPFGLKAADEAKLRSYRSFLDTKYGAR